MYMKTTGQLQAVILGRDSSHRLQLATTRGYMLSSSHPHRLNKGCKWLEVVVPGCRSIAHPFDPPLQHIDQLIFVTQTGPPDRYALS